MRKQNKNNTIEINNKEIKIDLERLQEDVKNAYKSMQKILPEAVLIDREIKPFGNASHIILPKEYAKKKATVIIKE